ncbi:MAG TPA: hypothetical protein VHM19_04835 [Polyangiales bacterium]|nr:hypothetical protein [Polyangiales bacterium]
MAETSNNADAPVRETAGARLAAKRAAKAAQKAAAKGTAQPGAEVVKSMTLVSDWLDAHQKQLWLGGLGVIALGVAWVVIGRFASQSDREAAVLLRAAVTTTQGTINTAEDPAPEDAILPSFPSTEERDKKALEQFQAVPKKFADTAAAHWAQLGEGNTQLAMGKVAEAEKAYAAALAGAGSDTFLQARATEGLGYALSAQKKYAEALKRFEELSKIDNGANKTLGDYHQARMLVALGKKPEALKILEALLKANAEKPATESQRYASVIDSSETLLTELGGTAPQKSSSDLSDLGGGIMASGGGKGISPELLEQLRKQIAASKKAPGQ